MPVKVDDQPFLEDMAEMDSGSLSQMADVIHEIIGGSVIDYNGSPDFPELLRQSSHYLFVYGTLKSGFSRSKLLDECPCIGVGYTRQPWFTMYRTRTKTNTYPVILPNADVKERAKIYGEVYQVPPSVLRETDYIESNGVVYKRLRIPVTVMRPKNEVLEMQPWMYIGIKDYWDKNLKYMEKCDLNVPNANSSEPYYSFKKSYIQTA